ncbi:MAG TPA: ABC transporter permease [Chloroflexia bacterium]|jgi:ABC-2 type transport system permease protein|nr:ABC transporter permease [Chloroflexia bacterium]
MSTPAYALRDSLTMLRRELRHTQRYPVMLISSIATPIIMLLLFDYVLGGAMGAGLASLINGSGSYIDYLAPGIILMTICTGSATTALSVNSDLREGIIARFRTMAISRSALLVGHVASSVIRTIFSTALLLAVALLLGFRPHAGVVEWFALFGLIVLFAFAVAWLSVALGLATRSPAAANTSTMPLQFLLPITSSAFVPLASMPEELRWFAEHQPLTPIIETIRGLLLGNAIGNNGLPAVAWCAVIAVIGYLWAQRAFDRGPAQ